MNDRPVNDKERASAVDRCSAVGVPESYWFIAIVKNNTEFSTLSKLEEKGYEAYVPYQVRTVATPRGGKRKRNCVVIPTMIFIHCTEEERKIIVSFPFINRFMVDRMCSKDSFNKSPIAHIPDEQINKLKFMLWNCDKEVLFEPLSLKVKDEVEVIRGGLKGLIGNVERIDNDVRLYIRIDALGYAGVRINASDVKILKNGQSS